LKSANERPAAGANAISRRRLSITVIRCTVTGGDKSCQIGARSNL